MYRNLLLGGLSAVGCAAYVRTHYVSADSKRNKVTPFSDKEWRKFKLREIQDVNHNSKIFKFQFANEQDKDSQLELPVASCITVRYFDEKEKKEIKRPYTPLMANTVGEFQLLIKRYPHGPMSTHIHNLKIGDELECMGPWGKIPIQANMSKSLGLIAGGTGLTPMLQIIEHMLSMGNDNTVINFLFANVSEEDILLKNRLDTLSEKYPNRFRVYYIIDSSHYGWGGFTGYITEDVLKKTMPPPGKDTKIFVCGPPGMMKLISGEKKDIKDQGELTGLLKNLGYTKDMVFKF